MSPSQKMMELLASLRGKTKGREFSRPRDLRTVVSTQNFKSKKFLATSPVFMRKYSKEVSVASHLIAANLKKLKEGQVVEKDGFIIKLNKTGKTHTGNNTDLTMSVSFKGRTCFVKIGVDSGEGHAVAYQKAKDFFKSKGNMIHGFKVEVVPYHLLYLKSVMRSGKSRGFLVSDFFPKEKVTLVSDIEETLGKQNFQETSLGQALDSIKHELTFKEGVHDAGTHNCFFDEAKRTIYFFDLWSR